MQTKQWTETNVSSHYVGVLNLETIIPSSAFIFSTNSVISFSQIIWLRWYNSWICFITQKVKWKNSSVRHLLLLYFIPFPSHSEWWLVRLVSVEWLCGRHLRGKPAHSNKNLHLSHTKWRGSLVHGRKCGAVRLFEWVFAAKLLFFEWEISIEKLTHFNISSNDAFFKLSLRKCWNPLRKVSGFRQVLKYLLSL